MVINVTTDPKMSFPKIQAPINPIKRAKSRRGKKVKRQKAKEHSRGPFANFSRKTHNARATLSAERQREVDTVELKFRQLLAAKRNQDLSPGKGHQMISNFKDLIRKEAVLRREQAPMKQMSPDLAVSPFNQDLTDLKSL